MYTLGDRPDGRRSAAKPPQTCETGQGVMSVLDKSTDFEFALSENEMCGNLI